MAGQWQIGFLGPQNAPAASDAASLFLSTMQGVHGTVMANKKQKLDEQRQREQERANQVNEENARKNIAVQQQYADQQQQRMQEEQHQAAREEYDRHRDEENKLQATLTDMEDPSSPNYDPEGAASLAGRYGLKREQVREPDPVKPETPAGLKTVEGNLALQEAQDKQKQMDEAQAAESNAAVLDSAAATMPGGLMGIPMSLLFSSHATALREGARQKAEGAQGASRWTREMAALETLPEGEAQSLLMQRLADRRFAPETMDRENQAVDAVQAQRQYEDKAAAMPEVRAKEDANPRVRYTRADGSSFDLRPTARDEGAQRLHDRAADRIMAAAETASGVAPWMPEEVATLATLVKSRAVAPEEADKMLAIMLQQRVSLDRAREMAQLRGAEAAERMALSRANLAERRDAGLRQDDEDMRKRLDAVGRAGAMPANIAIFRQTKASLDGVRSGNGLRQEAVRYALARALNGPGPLSNQDYKSITGAAAGIMGSVETAITKLTDGTIGDAELSKLYDTVKPMMDQYEGSIRATLDGYKAIARDPRFAAHGASARAEMESRMRITGFDDADIKATLAEIPNTQPGFSGARRGGGGGGGARASVSVSSKSADREQLKAETQQILKSLLGGEP